MSRRTQIYLSDEQRARIDEIASRRRVTMAEVVRLAVDAYLEREGELDETFGTARGIRKTVPSRDEWARG
jgi:predicted transcriptional regulator